MQVNAFTQKFKAIEDCLNHFDFDKVYQVMQYLDWKWYSPDHGYKVPSIERMKRTALSLASDAYDGVVSGHQHYVSGTGGFEAFAYQIEDTGEIVVKMKFILEMS